MATFSASLTASNLTGDIAAARMSTNIRTAISDAGGVRDAETAAAAAIALSKLATAPLTEFYAEVSLQTWGPNNTAICFKKTSSGTANTRSALDAMAVGTIASTAYQGDAAERLIDFARLTGFTVTWAVTIDVASGTGTFALRNVTDASDLTTVSTTSTTFVKVESASITVPTAEKTVTGQIENTGTSVVMDMGTSNLRVKAG